jgi:probable HAF family extracellular repeat protein
MINRAKKWIVLNSVGVVTAALGCSLSASAQAGKAPYTLVDLGLMGPAGQPFQITNNGIVPASVEAKNGTYQAVIYFDQYLINVGKPGLGGANSEAVGANDWGEVVGGADIPGVDPDGEDFCGFQSLGAASAKASCRPFLWQDGSVVELPTLGDNHGNNGVANSINDHGEIVGSAENSKLEKSCPTYDAKALQFQQYQFKPVLWWDHATLELATVGGDPVGSAVGINKRGQAVGSTGTCAVFNFFGYPMQPLHAVLWERDGAPVDLGSLGGDEKSVWGNHAQGINNSGHIVGASSLSDDVTLHGFFWSGETSGMKDLKPIKNTTKITNSFAVGINDSDVVVGVSTDFTTQFVATIWKKGVATDLNTLIPAKSSLYLLSGCSINSSGQIIGLAADAKGNFHAYELIPNGEPQW